jgi:hypothetical protein
MTFKPVFFRKTHPTYLGTQALQTGDDELKDEFTNESVHESAIASMNGLLGA